MIMNYEEFQKQFEIMSERIFAELSALSEEALLRIIADKNEQRYNIWRGHDNYQIWTALGEKGTKKSLKPLFDIVSDLDKEYLVRYHACTALFKIAKIEDEDFKGQVQYGLDKNGQAVDQRQAILTLQEILKSKFPQL